MLNVVIAMLLAMPVYKVLPRMGDVHLGYSQFKIADADADTISALPSNDGWRAYLMPQHKNIIAISQDTLISIWGPPSGDATYFFLGVKAGYSFDGGHTWTSYDLSTNFVRRIYPSSYFDATTNTPWFVWQEIDSAADNGGEAKLMVGYDAAFPFGIMTTAQLPTAGITFWVPDIFAKGDTVLVVGVNGYLGYWRSTNKGQTFTLDTTTLTNLFSGNYDIPFFLYDNKTNRVYIATLDTTDTHVAIAWTDDMGATWNGPMTDTIPHGPFTNNSGWYYYDGVVDTLGIVHIGLVSAYGNYENGILFDLKFSLQDTSFTSTLIAGDLNVGDTAANAPFYHNARVPSMAIGTDGNLYAIYWYADTVTLNDTLYALGDIAVSYSPDNGGSWYFLGYLDGTHDSPYTDKDEGRGESARNVIVDGDRAYIHYVFAYDDDGYAAFLHYGNAVTISDITEAKVRNSKDVVISSIANGSLDIQFASDISVNNVNIRLFNINGQLVKNITVPAGNSIHVPVSHLRAGVYLVKVVAGKMVHSERVVVLK